MKQTTREPTWMAREGLTWLEQEIVTPTQKKYRRRKKLGTTVEQYGVKFLMTDGDEALSYEEYSRQRLAPVIAELARRIPREADFGRLEIPHAAPICVCVDGSRACLRLTGMYDIRVGTVVFRFDVLIAKGA